jgi:hypothetical protein
MKSFVTASFCEKWDPERGKGLRSSYAVDRARFWVAQRFRAAISERFCI